jgi:UDP-glucose 4-epimerase
MENGRLIAITGSEGLIGQSLIRRLKNLHIPYKCIDNRLNIDALGNGDICHKDRLVELLAGCTGIVHLAAVSRVVWGEQQPDLCWQVNVLGTHNLLEIAFA